MSIFIVYVKYILNNFPYLFLFSKYYNKKTSKLLIPYKLFYYQTLHIRMSSFNYLTQLVDIYSFEINKKLLTGEGGPAKTHSHLVLVYNFQNLLNNQRTLLFLAQTSMGFKVKSVVELFPNANWLEREVAELFGFVFSGKNDTRNLMLQYGDTSAPFKKTFPTIGLKELYYNLCTDLITQTPLHVQI